MKKEILIAVVSSLLTAVILSVAAVSAGLFEKKLAETQVHDAARELIDSHSDALIQKLMLNKDFMVQAKGPKGDKGNEGPQGIPGKDGSVASICNRTVFLQGRNGKGYYIGENKGKVYSKYMSKPGSFETFKIRCQD